MDRFDRIFNLHKLLVRARVPRSRAHLEAALEISRATLTRTIRDMRNFLGAPIEFDRVRNGYFYQTQTGGGRYELPGLWFNAEETMALLACQKLLSNLQPGLLDQEIEPIRARLEKQLAARQGGRGQLINRVRILDMSRRPPAAAVFGPLSTALTQRLQLRFGYDGRGAGTASERLVSPQRLVHYRDNWYLDAWDHDREALRSFAVERIRAAHAQSTPAHNIPDAELDAQLAAGYGIFSGPVAAWAVLRFTAVRARWVADEQWHPAQTHRWLEDGRYELSVPYSDARELLSDILKHGPDCEVIAPAELRAAAAAQLRAAAALYPPAGD
ncbi:MAG: YafY family transcriptional regulator [Gammaproteobacteria bacterium]|nr:YafY family transcriptional regulator [Gammaproteobacteria bacterium]